MKYEDILNGGKDVEVLGLGLENPSLEMLIVTEDNFVEQLSKQSAGIAYYGTLTKMLEAQYANLETAWKAKYAEFYSYCSNLLKKTKDKYVAKDVEALINSKYVTEIEKWNNKLSSKKEELNVTTMFYEGWKQKSFSLNNFTSLATSNLLSVRDTISEDQFGDAPDNSVLSMVEKHKQNLNNK